MCFRAPFLPPFFTRFFPFFPLSGPVHSPTTSPLFTSALVPPFLTPGKLQFRYPSDFGTADLCHVRAFFFPGASRKYLAICCSRSFRIDMSVTNQAPRGGTLLGGRAGLSEKIAGLWVWQRCYCNIARLARERQKEDSKWEKVVSDKKSAVFSEHLRFPAPICDSQNLLISRL